VPKICNRMEGSIRRHHRHSTRRPCWTQRLASYAKRPQWRRPPRRRRSRVTHLSCRRRRSSKECRGNAKPSHENKEPKPDDVDRVVTQSGCVSPVESTEGVDTPKAMTSSMTPSGRRRRSAAMARRLFGRHEDSPSLFALSPLRRGSTPCGAESAALASTPARKRRDVRRRTFFNGGLLTGSAKKNRPFEEEGEAQSKDEEKKVKENDVEVVVTKRDYSENVQEALKLGLPVIPFTHLPSPSSATPALPCSPSASTQPKPDEAVSPCVTYPHEATFQDCLEASRPCRRRAGSLDRGPVRQPSSLYLAMDKGTPMTATSSIHKHHKHCRSCTCPMVSPNDDEGSPSRPREWPPSHQDYVRVEKLRQMELQLAGSDMQF